MNTKRCQQKLSKVKGKVKKSGKYRTNGPGTPEQDQIFQCIVIIVSKDERGRRNYILNMEDFNATID